MHWADLLLFLDYRRKKTIANGNWWDRPKTKHILYRTKPDLKNARLVFQNTPWMKASSFSLKTQQLDRDIQRFAVLETTHSPLYCFSISFLVALAKHHDIGANGCSRHLAVFLKGRVSSEAVSTAPWFLLFYHTSLSHIPRSHYLVQVEFPPLNAAQTTLSEV